MIFQSACTVLHSPVMYEDSDGCFIPSPAFGAVSLFNLYYSSEYEMISRAFNLHFPDDE